MPGIWKHRKKRSELLKENAELQQLVSKLEGQMKLQIEMLYNANIELKQLKRTNTKYKFNKDNLSNLNYKLRTPMNDIIGMSNLLDDITPDSEKKNYISFIKKASGNLLNILNDVIFYMKSEYNLLPVDNKQMNLKALLEELNTSFKTQYFASHQKVGNEDIELFLNIDNKMPDVLYGDESKIKLLIQNVLNFMLVNTKKGIVFTQARVIDKTIEETIIDIKISNSSEIIDEEFNEKIFVPFALADKSNANNQAFTGLELAISKSLVNLMGGEIIYESNKATGNIFLISLRLNNSSIQNATNTYNQKERDTLNKYKDPSQLTLILAEDNEINQKFIELSLKPIGLRIDMAKNEEELIKKFRGYQYDVVLMNIEMPDINGIETTKILRHIEKARMADTKTLIVGMSADSDNRMRESFKEEGMDEQINKPFKPLELLEIINKYNSDNKT